MNREKQLKKENISAIIRAISGRQKKVPADVADKRRKEKGGTIKKRKYISDNPRNQRETKKSSRRLRRFTQKKKILQLNFYYSEI